MYRENHPGPLSLPAMAMWSPPSDEAIPLPKQSHHDNGQRSRQASTCSERSCEGMSLDETRELWRCMLELQLRYGCYNSTRIDMAVDAGECGVDLMPNRFIIDTLNESVIDLPDEGRELLNRYLCPSSPTKQKWKFWKKD
ncbi:hypothetical protein FGADI_3310 [Fusarium gaditjirri]|uniref:Uncharacterized protein n=1 Tax=Fusarium gaditjirri TaxID=282569 RepID=A0A8H4X0Z2_9HYPO|nr:hypothetical protein FGADI_3310 [Fusarium gaditjirri]